MSKRVKWALGIGLALILVLVAQAALGELIFMPLVYRQSTSTPSAAVTRTSTILPSPIDTFTPTFTPTASTPTRTPHLTQTPTETATETPLPQVVRFAVIGDYGEGSQAEADVATLVKSWDLDFILTTGDNNYPDGSSSTIDENIGQLYHEFIFPYVGGYGEGANVNRFFPSLGNHDWHAAGAQPYLDYFTLPGNERYYDFTWGPLHFFALDSDPKEPDGVGRSSDQAAWLQSQLATSTAPWKVVYMHHAPYSSARHGSIDWMQWPYAEWGASIVLAGHDHTYERLEVDGMLYVVDGLGGSSKYPFHDPLPGSLVRYNGDYGALQVEASETALSFQFINRSGEVIDTFELTLR
jgi:hypothetical protein